MSRLRPLFALLALAGCEGFIALPGTIAGAPPPGPTDPTNPTRSGTGPTTLPPAPIDPMGMPAKDCGTTYLPGHTLIHRLDNAEYNNTVRDLLFTSSHPADTFASSSIGSSGFSNQSDVLTVSDQLANDYVTAAQALADEARSSKGQSGGAWAQLTGCAYNVASPSMSCQTSVVQGFAERAFRRPIDPDDLTLLMTVVAGESTFDDGFHDAIVAVLIDPRFFFNYVNHTAPDDPNTVVALDDYELASRLSYFLWQSMPDDQLFTLASMGQLKDATTLGLQVKRMLADPKAVGFATAWRRDWAKLTLLDGTTGYGGVSAQLSQELKQQTELMVEDVVSRDASLLELVSTDHTFVNSDLATFYGWSLPSVTSSTFVRVQNPDANRLGVLTQAGLMLTVGGGESYTHPVQRGRWVMDSLLCQAPGAPPPGVPSLPGPISSTDTMKQRLNAHVASPQCQACHATMDVYGLGLENFDMQGHWRDVYAELNNTPIDATGMLPDGRSFQTPAQMMTLLANDPKVQGCLAQKVMMYALARPLGSQDDFCVANTLGTQYAQSTSSLSDLFTHVALSHQFLMQAGASP
jgi:hypothetical protein